MKAVRIHHYGTSDVLTYEEAQRPQPKDGEMLIRVHATTVNPFDIAYRAGYLAGFFNPSFPLILGTDVSGVVEEVGAGVTAFKPGDEVFARAGVYRDGSYAEYVIVSESDAAPKPKTLDHTASAALPHVTLTAWQALYEAANLSAGQTVLIHGAAGGVGHMAVQLARLRGAKVIGTASINLGFIKELGVDEAIDYTVTPFESVARNVDVVLDTQGGDSQERSWGVLKPGGMLVSTIQPPSAETAAAHGVRQHYVFTTPPIRETLQQVAELVDRGRLMPKVFDVMPIQEIRKAHQIMEGKHVPGKLVVQVVQ